jgi:hypothetical protein
MLDTSQQIELERTPMTSDDLNSNERCGKFRHSKPAAIEAAQMHWQPL